MNRTLIPLLLLLAAAAPAHPRLDGTWMLDPGQGPGFGDGAAKASAPPLTTAAQTLYDQRRRDLAAGKGAIDPTAACLPLGFPRDMSAHFPIQIVTDPQKVTLIFPSTVRARRIFLDRTAHDPDMDPQFNGDSIGHWQGDALVVDTVGFKPGVWLDGRGAPQGEDLHVTERIRLIDGGKRLEDRITVADPKVFTRPWTATKTYSRRPDSVLTDGLCEELSVGHPRWAAK